MNNIQINYNQNSPFIDSNDLIDLLRVSHHNHEDKKILFKICRPYDHVFLKGSRNLTFPNQVKHRINTIDDLPIYTKSYRYPYVHK